MRRDKHRCGTGTERIRPGPGPAVLLGCCSVQSAGRPGRGACTARAGGSVAAGTTVADIVCTVCRAEANGRIVFTESGIDVLRCVECGHIMSSYKAAQHYDEYFDVPGRLDTFRWDQ